VTIKTNRRRFLATTASVAAAAALPGCATEAQRPPQRGARGNPFQGVRPIEDRLRRIPSDQYPLPFTEQEYADRLRRCKEAMAKAQIDLLLVTWPEGLCYLHGYEVTWYRTYWTPLTVTAVHVNQDKMIFYGGEDPVPSAAKDRRRNTGGRDPQMQVKFLLDDLQKEGWLKSGTRVGMEYQSYLPTPFISQMLDAGCKGKGAKVTDGSSIMRTIRNIKSPAEIEAMDHAARIADIGHKAIADTFEPGMSHLEVYAAAWHAMHVAGGEVQAIPQAVLPASPTSIHLLPGRRQIQAGEPFAFDLCGVYKRYHVNVARTFIYGDPHPDLVKLDEQARGAFAVVERTAKAGTPVKTVNAELRRYYTEVGLRPSGIGYETGIAMAPDWVGHFVFRPGDENPPEVFETNMVTQYETTFRQEIAGKPALATHIDSYVYGPGPARRQSAVPLNLVVMG
jgi:Xaa-Pro aminopeptidase